MAVQLHQLGAVMQYVVFGISVALALFFIVQTRRKNVNWEIIFATAALATLYMLERQWGPAGPADISMTSSGRRLPWFRYGEWLLTFPPLLAAVANLTGLGRRKWGQGMALLGALQVALLGGVTAAYSTGLAAKIVFACIAAAAYAVVLVLTSLTFGLTYREVPLSLRGFVSLLRALLLLTWLVYPVTWALGPAGFRRISFDGETVAFAFADIFAKCAWSVLLWYFRRTVQVSVPAQFWATQADAQAAPGAVGDTGVAQQLLGKGDPVLVSGRRFQPAVAEVGEGSPSGKEPLLLEEPEEVPLTGWPLGLARTRVHVAPRDVTRPRASPRFWFPGLSDQIRTEQAAYSPTGTPFPVTRPSSLLPSPRQELETAEGVTVYRNPLALTESGEQEVGDAAVARARGRELAIDIPGEGSGQRTPEWGGAESSEDRKRTWAAFIRSFGAQKSPPETKSEEGEAGYKTLARPEWPGSISARKERPGESQSRFCLRRRPRKPHSLRKFRHRPAGSREL
ncbi:hypothetical protein KFL_003440060 [Klebsormidium nitens]|uniref:Rhodopsin n=1 Tax=Klebsormidium nitens TaxID=105231 RepID=A0A1Y1I8I9_KLENI|nr:hypothetical protein KFL_003440060 [Klebsormidium nitens]|eukprot:GAQ87305.1 hypothetical protein KFL_003440060 [Klebsormidium nitens]